MEWKTDQIKSKITDVGPCKRELNIEVSAEKAGEEFDKVLIRYATRVKLPGFRAGKAPKDMVRKMFFHDIRESVIETLASEAVIESLKIHDLHPVTQPVLGSVVFDEGKPFSFLVSFEVMPEFTLSEYKKVKVKARLSEVTVEEIMSSLESLRQKAAEYVPVEGRGVQDGDYVVVELQGRDKKTRKLMPAEKVVILAGHAENEKDIDNALKGLKAGESGKAEVVYPAEHSNPRLSGKTMEYDLRVSDIKEKRIPEINDDFAKDMGDFGSLADLKEEIKKELVARKDAEAKREVADEVVTAVADRMTFDLPETLVEEESASILNGLISSFPHKDWKREDLEPLKETARKQAAQALKKRLILRKIAEREAMIVSEEDVQEEIRALARANKVSVLKMTEHLNKDGGRDSLKDRLLLRKAIDFLVQNAIME